MKQKTIDKVIWLYKFWSVILLVVFVFLADYRLEVFNVWWILTAVFMMYLLINILHLVSLKKKLSKGRLKELSQGRNERLSRRAGRIGKSMEDES